MQFINNLTLFISIACAAGSYSTTGYTPCTPCPVGQYNTATTQRSCTRCTPPTTTLSTGSTSCVARKIYTSVSKFKLCTVLHCVILHTDTESCYINFHNILNHNKVASSFNLVRSMSHLDYMNIYCRSHLKNIHYTLTGN